MQVSKTEIKYQTCVRHSPATPISNSYFFYSSICRRLISLIPFIFLWLLYYEKTGYKNLMLCTFWHHIIYLLSTVMNDVLHEWRLEHFRLLKTNPAITLLSCEWAIKNEFCVMSFRIYLLSRITKLFCFLFCGRLWLEIKLDYF